LSRWAKFICGDEVGEVLTELIVAFVVEPLDRHILQRAVEPLDLAIIRYDGFGALRSR